MAHGRLDVYWPNGDFNSFLLDEDSVSVGRSSGSTIVLDTDTISRYHFSILREAGRSFVSDMDSANGTYVDGVQLQENENRELFGGEEIQIGHLRIVYYKEDDQPTVPLTDLSEETQRYERADVGFILTVTEPYTGVPPGAHKSIDIAVTNTTTETRLLTVVVEGLPAGWGRVNRPRLRIDPDETIMVALSIKPPRRSDTTPGSYPLTITVADQEDEDKVITAHASAEILPYSAFAMGLINRRITLYDAARLVVQNQGSQPLAIHVSGTSADDALRFDIPQPQRILKPGEKDEVRVSVQPRQRRILGQPEEHAFDLLVRSQDAAGFLAPIRARLTVDPVLPTWAAYAIGGLALGVVALLIVALVLLLQASQPSPEIVAVQISQDRVISGTPISVTLDLKNVERVDVLVNGDVVQRGVLAEEATINVPTDAYSDQTLNVEIIAYGEGEAVSTSFSVEVLPRPELIDLTVSAVGIDGSPRPFFANVVTTIQVSWQVTGADSTRIDGEQSIRLAEAAPLDIAPVDGPAFTSTTFEGYVEDPFSVTLFAVNRLGQEVAFPAVNIDVQPPTCRPLAPGVQLHEYPNVGAQVVSTVQDGAPLPVFTVDRRTLDGAWLRVTGIAEQERWVQVVDVTCDSFDPAALREQVVPTLTPTPTIPPTATPLPATATPLPATATPLPPTATPLPATATPLPPTATPLPATVTPLPATNTPLPATNTPILTATPMQATNTPILTNTPVLPIPATATPVPWFRSRLD